MGGQQFGLAFVIGLLAVTLALKSGTHVDHQTGHTVNNFLNPSSLLQIATETSFFAIMAVGAALVIITGGIDLSVGSISALSGVSSAMLLRAMNLSGPSALIIGLLAATVIATLCGLLNGIMVVKLGVHPFIITLGTMWIYRGTAFVMSQANSIPMPQSVTNGIKSTFGLGLGLYPIPLLVMVTATVAGTIYLNRTIAGRNIFAVGGNAIASELAGVRLPRVLIGVYCLSGLAAGVSAFLGSGYYGSVSCADAQGYELYVIASAVVGGVSLIGGKGSAIGATLGALLIILIRQSISYFRWDQNYQWIIIGAAIICAVVIDRTSSILGMKRLMGSQAPGDT